jgi:hypothetical protein
MVHWRSARIASTAAWLLIAAALPAPALAARSSDDTRPAGRLVDDYPLPQAQDGAAITDRPVPSTKMATAPSNDFERLALPSILALLAGGLTSWLVSTRWPRARLEPAESPATGTNTAPVHSIAPELWVHNIGAPAAPTAQPDTPPAAPVPDSQAPPEPNRAWAAEIEWHLVDDASQFRVTARPVDGDGEPVTLRASDSLEWPPGGARSVKALTDAVKALEAGLVAAGWTPLPRGSAWYAKRFTWQPGARLRAPSPTAGRMRHRTLYDAEYQRQIDRSRRLRATISARVTADGGADATGMAPQ